MTNSELETSLRKMTQGSRWGIFFVGTGTFLLGFFAGVCGVFRGDPDMRHYSHAMWLAYALMVAFFGGVGLLTMVWGLFVVPRNGNDFVNRVLHHPETITRIWLLLVKSNYTPANQPGQLGVSTSLCARTQDGKHFQFMVNGRQAQTLLEEIARRAPNATLGPPD